MVNLRFGVYLVQKAAAVVLVEDAGEAPWVVLEGLNVLDLHEKNVARLCCLDFKGTRQIVDLGQVDVLHVVGAVIVLDLASSPVHTLDLDGLTILDGPTEGY